MNNTQIKKKIGNRLREAREAMPGNVSQAKLCRMLKDENGWDLDVQRYKKWELGENRVSLEYLEQLCKVFDCEVGYLLCMQDTPKREPAEISKSTGLTYEACEMLIKKFSSYEEYIDDEFYLNQAQTLSALILNEDFWAIINFISFCTRWKTESLIDFDDLFPADKFFPVTDGNYGLAKASMVLKFNDILESVITKQRIRRSDYDNEENAKYYDPAFDDTPWLYE